VTVIYTNVGAFMARTYATKANDKMQTSMERLSSGTRINSAAAEATRAVETLDKALEEVSTAQAKLGAIQNRLTHNIDNLSKGSMLTEQSVGRIVDADFATETSELSKQQILAQAATSMLAQANQSKQSVLALLQ
jgi:flagellin